MDIIIKKEGTYKLSADALVSLLKDCIKRKNIQKGRELCSFIVQNALHFNPFVGNHVIHFFSFCGSLSDAIQIFRAIPKPDLYSWKAIISAHEKHGQCGQAISLFQELQQLKVRPNDHIFVAVLKACANLKALPQGRLIHSDILKAGYGSNIFVGCSLVDMYTRCGSVEEAFEVFNQLPERDVILWSSMIEGFARHGLGLQALKVFKEMQKENLQADKVTFVSALKACTSIESLVDGQLIHAQIVEKGFEIDQVVGSALVHMYAKCGRMDEAHHLFTKLPEKNVVCWNALISGYARHGLGQKALEMFKSMRQERVKADEITYVATLKACGSLAALSDGKLIHSQIIKNQIEISSCLGSALVDMYAKCGSLNDAIELFEKLPKRDVVSWNTIIGAHVFHGLGNRALQLYERMQRAGMKPNRVSHLSILKACSLVSSLDHGKMIHSKIIGNSEILSVDVGNCLLDMYVKCGSLSDANRVFDNMGERDVISWSTMISGCARHGMSQQAFQYFNKMRMCGVKPNRVTFISMFKVLGSKAALHEGKMVHAQMIESGIVVDVQLGSALVDMYAKCGSLEMSHSVFESLQEKNAISWSSLIACYGQHGLGLEALQIFEKMKYEGVKPDDATFVSVLSACSHACLLEKGMFHYQSMSRDFGIDPNMQHYLCMVDLFGRTGKLSEAKNFIEQMPLQPDAAVWISLLGACCTHCNLELGRYCFESVLRYDPENSAAYVLMSNLYSSAG